jgi:hypothetical protein
MDPCCGNFRELYILAENEPEPLRRQAILVEVARAEQMWEEMLLAWVSGDRARASAA